MKPDLVFGFENAGWPALLVDKAGTVLRSNKFALETFGPQILGGAKLQSIWAADNPMTSQAFLERWERQPAASTVLKFNARGAQQSFTTVVCALKEGEAPLYVFQLFPDLGAGLGSSDATPIEGTIQKQKLDVAVKLARAVALDFRNALSGVLGHSSLLLMQAPPDHPWRKSLVEIEKAVSKGTDAAASLGSFNKADREQQASAGANVNSVLKKAADTLGAAAVQRNVQWEFQLERRIFAAKLDELKVLQAFTKIIENSLEAMPNGGRVTFSTRNLELSQPTQDRTAKLLPGAYVCAEIADNGSGIEPENLPRIFEPFFTTKSAGKHRGLGLPWVYGVIVNLGGGVAVSSEARAGTSVRIYLPAEKHFLIESTQGSEELSDCETVLIVDDEEIITVMGQTVLSSYGYKALAATSGKKALEILAQPETKVDLLLTDLVMPGMSGTELVENARKLDPSLPVLFMSGAIPGSDQSNKSYLPKPFTSQQLLEKVRMALAEKDQ